MSELEKNHKTNEKEPVASAVRAVPSKRKKRKNLMGVAAPSVGSAAAASSGIDGAASASGKQLSHTISEESFKPNELSLRLAAERARIHSLIDQNFKKSKEKKSEPGKTYIYVAVVQFTNRSGKLGICHWSLAKDKLLTKCKESFTDIIIANCEASVSLDMFEMEELNSVCESTPAMYDRLCNVFMPMIIARGQ